MGGGVRPCLRATTTKVIPTFSRSTPSPERRVDRHPRDPSPRCGAPAERSSGRQPWDSVGRGTSPGWGGRAGGFGDRVGSVIGWELGNRSRGGAETRRGTGSLSGAGKKDRRRKPTLVLKSGNWLPGPGRSPFAKPPDVSRDVKHGQVKVPFAASLRRRWKNLRRPIARNWKPGFSGGWKRPGPGS